ncbi:hypothetical protein LINPERHAP2_LOCUS14965 [Linum perenne]
MRGGLPITLMAHSILRIVGQYQVVLFVTMRVG